MNTKHRQRYTAEFKAQVVGLMGPGKPVTGIAEELFISSNMLYKWKQEAQGAPSGNKGSPAADERLAAADWRSLRGENDFLQSDKDILKKGRLSSAQKPSVILGVP
jgi:transposase-like protein